VLARHHYGEISKTLFSKSTCWGASLKCLYTNAHSVGKKRDELQICVQLQGYDVIGIMEM